jgi:hypothetical protein
MGNATMAEDTVEDTDVTGDAPVGLGANLPNAPIVDTPVPQDTTDLDLDQLIAEFELGTQQQTQQVDQPVDQNVRDRAYAANLDAITEGLQIDARRAELQTAAQALQQEYDQRDAAAAFETIRGNLPTEMFSNEMLDSWITGQSVRDPAIQRAWQNRAVDPKAYQRTLEKLAGEFGDKFRRFQAESEVDHEAVAQAVRGASAKTAPEPPPDFARMSDFDLQKWKNENMK